MIIPESKYLESVIALCQSTQGAMLKNMEQEYIAPYIGKTLSPSDFFAEEDNLIHFILKQMRVLNKHLLTYDLYTKRLATNDFQYDLSGAHAEFRLRLFSTSQSFTTDANHVQHHAYSKDSASYDIIEGDSLKKPLFLI